MSWNDQWDAWHREQRDHMAAQIADMEAGRFATFEVTAEGKRDTTTASIEDTKRRMATLDAVIRAYGERRGA